MEFALKYLADVKTNFPEADFWLIRVHSKDTVGKPVKEFKPEYIGIKVTETDWLDPDYLFYMFQYLQQSGEFAKIATGTTNRVNINISQVGSIVLKIN